MSDMVEIIITIGEVIADGAVVGFAAAVVGPLLYVAWLAVTRRPMN
jgi:hypothetical protein